MTTAMERVGERARERVSERASGRVIDRTSERVRERVRASYGAAVTGGESCCADSCCGGVAPEDLAPNGAAPNAVTPKGVAAKVAGYSAEELAALPESAVVNSFGCGNPLAFSDVEPGQVVLDLGSGAGIDLLLAVERVGPEGRVIGVDMTDAMIDRARQAASAAGRANVDVRKGLIEDLPVDSASVDWVISNCVINLSPEKGRVFAEIARVLKPGGRISISDIVIERMPWWIRKSGRLHSACVAGAISESDYVAGLQRAGLAEVEVGERLVYDASQLASLAESEVATFSLPSWLRPPATRLLAGATRRFAGRVWSAKFTGRRGDVSQVGPA